MGTIVSNVGNGVAEPNLISGAGVKVSGKGVEVAVGKGVIVGAGMNSGVQAARAKTNSAMRSGCVFMFPFTA